MHYIQGKNTPINVVEGIKYLKIASSLGFFQSSYNLGLLYYEGNIVERNPLESKKYFTIALEQNKNNPSILEYLQAIEIELKQEEELQKK